MKIEELCESKEQELLKKYFGAGAVRSETIGEYTKDLPMKIEAEYKAFLEEIWPQYAPEDMKDQPLVFDEQKLRELMTDDDREMIEYAHKDAERRTLWERITRSNYNDVNYYVGLLHEYTRDLLMVMRLDFLEEITGNYIRNKTFEPD